MRHLEQCKTFNCAFALIQYDESILDHCSTMIQTSLWRKISLGNSYHSGFKYIWDRLQFYVTSKQIPSSSQRFMLYFLDEQCNSPSQINDWRNEMKTCDIWVVFRYLQKNCNFTCCWYRSLTRPLGSTRLYCNTLRGTGHCALRTNLLLGSPNFNMPMAAQSPSSQPWPSERTIHNN